MVEEKKPQKRQIAEKVRVKDILSGRYIQEEGWNPNYIELDDSRRISRVNIIGAVVEKEEGQEINYNSIVLDDGSGTISVRVFGEDMGKLAGISVGDVVLIIGRPREYGNEKYLLLEIIKKVENKKWIDVRRLELGVKKETVVEEKKEIENVKEEAVEETVISESVGDKIIEFVRNNDKGDGVDIQEIVNEFKDEKEVKNLLSEGELFEVKPGRVKVLE
ncbi:hypothetical protein KY332_02405 [Candidatus Woesearchaeota archaeon]|nr:hypothetical protein [Candidatus Woesearchaeota archaeon]